MIDSRDLNSLPVINRDIFCSRCARAGALCCRSDTVIPLSKKEARQLQADGTELRLFPTDEVPDGVGGPGFRRKFYQFIGDCASLQDDGRCSNYERRTRACQEFEVGGFWCQLLNMREQETATDLVTQTDQTLE